MLPNLSFVVEASAKIGSCMILTSVPSSDDLLQNLILEHPLQGFNRHIVVCSGCEANQGNNRFCPWQTELGRTETRLVTLTRTDSRLSRMLSQTLAGCYLLYRIS